MININTKNGYIFDYRQELPDVFTVDKENEIYFSKTLDKFYRKVSENYYRELREYTNRNGTKYIQYRMNNKRYCKGTTTFRQTLE